MSWDQHVAAKIPAGKYDSAVLIGKDGAVWTPATDNGFGAEAFSAIVQKLADLGQLRAAGPTVKGTKYFITNGEDSVFVNGKKGDAGFSAHATNTAVAVLFFSDGKSDPVTANVDASQFAEYIKGLGF